MLDLLMGLNCVDVEIERNKKMADTKFKWGQNIC